VFQIALFELILNVVSLLFIGEFVATHTWLFDPNLLIFVCQHNLICLFVEIQGFDFIGGALNIE
jgi:hypothetical protein